MRVSTVSASSDISTSSSSHLHTQSNHCYNIRLMPVFQNAAFKRWIRQLRPNKEIQPACDCKVRWHPPPPIPTLAYRLWASQRSWVLEGRLLLQQRLMSNHSLQVTTQVRRHADKPTKMILKLFNHRCKQTKILPQWPVDKICGHPPFYAYYSPTALDNTDAQDFCWKSSHR